MDIFNNDNEKKITNQGQVVPGGFEAMVKMRKRKLPEIEENIRDMFKDYDGEMVAIIRMVEDENGESDHHSLFIGGVAQVTTQIKLARALDRASESVIEGLAESVASMDEALIPEMMGEVVKIMLQGKANKKKGKK